MNGIEVVAETDDPAFAVDQDGAVVAWNQAAEHCLGYRCPEVVGRPCWSILKCRDLSSKCYSDKSCPVRKLMSQNGPPRCDQLLFGLMDERHMQVRDNSGRATPVRMSTFLVQDETGTREIVHVL